ncbi:MAG: RNA-directed DNA polymerase [Polyangiaceae bacterium]|nr:RNA-directed DNA polymerase [Polyangiaceae bacterium]
MPPPRSTKPSAGQAPPIQAAAPPPPKPQPEDPLAAEILGLSAQELRKRAIKINPYQTAWIGRTDTIPPQNDERTAIIDRGLILRGLLTPDQITEIHRIGDQWLTHREAAKMAQILAARSVEEALAARRAEREAKKAQKKAESEARKARIKEEIARRKAEDIVYLGAGVSHLLHDRRSHLETLESRGLPILSTPADVARALNLPIGKLRWLCFHSEATEKPHYRYFEIPKRSGGTRKIAAPQPELAKAQEWIFTHILQKLPTEDAAHGFIPNRSTVTCAAPHVGKDVVINLDVKDFFPTITFVRVRGVFQKLGYSPAVATIFALLCTEAPRVETSFEGQTLWAAVGPRACPQGACTSPALSNQVARKLDRRFVGMSKKHGFVYTRYADDLTFSAPEGKRAEIGMLMARVRHILAEEGFTLHPDKGRVQRRQHQQLVTGIVVNQKLGLDRKHIRRLRAILHAAQKTGLEAQNRENIPHFEAHIRGHLAYLHMVAPDKAAPLLQALNSLPK